MPDEEIYTEEFARYICLTALHHERCAELLNTLANGGAVTLQISEPGTLPEFVCISAEQVRQLAEGSG
jgi:hypothetical protein